MSAINLSGLQDIIVRIGSIVLALAPGLIVASYVVCALVWVSSAGNQKMVKWAKDQTIATTVVFCVLVAYFLVKALIIAISQGGKFG